MTQVPRPSHEEEQISAYLANFGRDLALETTVDEVGNVLIRKPATPGMENRKGLILQAHMDMVAQKDADKVFDFQADPIQAYMEDGWIKANGTTLGADDGIGAAIIMALLEDKELVHGPLEGLFTVNEEDGFTGIHGLKSNLLKGDIYINVDSETEGEFTIGSAGGLYIDANENYSEEETPAQMVGYKIVIKGLKGGHSGTDINLGRGNAAKILSRLLWTSQRLFGLRIASFNGGDRYNAIPIVAEAVVAVPESESVSFAKYVQEFEATVQKELSITEPSLVIMAEKADLPAKLMAAKSAVNLISVVYSCPNGVLRMSDAVPGLVETSSSMGILKAEMGEFWAGFYVRSSLDSARDDTGNMIRSVFELAGANVSFPDSFFWLGA
ncbi:MAG: beta-Ala-His dipeptidase [Methanothrix sp.]|nr:beta-Ala-His dipeptidase [Methanothrix sp.]